MKQSATWVFFQRADIKNIDVWYKRKYEAARSILITALGVARDDASNKTISEFVDGLIEEETKRKKKADKEEFWKKVRFLFGLEV